MILDRFTNKMYLNTDSSLYLDGIDDYVNMWQNFTFPSNFSFSFFIYPMSFDSYIFSHINEAVIDVFDGFYIKLTANGGIELKLYDGTSNHTHTFDLPYINRNAWNHIAITIESNVRLKMYFNGVMKVDIPYTASAPTDPFVDMLIGSLQFDTPRVNNTFHGYISHFCIFDSILHSGHILEHLDTIGAIPTSLYSNILTHIPFQKESLIDNRYDLPILKSDAIFQFKYLPMDLSSIPQSDLTPVDVYKLYDCVGAYELESISNYPTYIKNDTFISFINSNSKMELVFKRNILAPYVFILVYSESNPPSGRKIKMAINTDYTNGISWEFDSGDADNTGDNLIGSNNTIFNIPKLTTSDFKVISIEFEATLSKMYVHDPMTAFGSGVLSMYNILEGDTLTIGYDSGLGGQPIVSEFIMLEGVLDDQKRTFLFNYLKNKYNI